MAQIRPAMQATRAAPDHMPRAISYQSAPTQTQLQTYSFALLDKYMQFIIPDANSRILGQQNIHFNILDVLAYWQDPSAQSEWGGPTVTTLFDRSGRLIAPFYAFLVNGIQMGTNFPLSLYFWGETTGINTVVTRRQFWKLYFISSIRENIDNRLHGRTGESFVPIPSQQGILTKQPVVSPSAITQPLTTLNPKR
jgi:hypothetical protein